MADNTVEIEVLINGQKAILTLNGIERAAKKTGKEVGDSFSSAGRIFDNFVANLGAKAVTSALGIAKDAASAFFKTFVVDGVKAASVQQDAVNQLNTALRSTGEFSRQASKDIQDFAAKLQSTTTTSDDVIIKQIALAQSFTNSAAKSKELVAAALDLSAAKDISLDSAVKNLGKTLGGLTGELGEIAPDLKKLSKTALESGEAIGFIADKFAGFAQSEAKTFSGAIKQSENEFQGLQKTFGAFFTESNVLVGLFNAISKEVKNIGLSLGGSASSFSSFQNAFKTTIIVALEFGKALASILDGITIIVRATFNIVQGVVGAIVSVFVQAIEIAADLNVKLASLGSNIPGLEGISNSIKGVSEGVRDFARDVKDSIRDGVVDDFGELKDSISRNAFSEAFDTLNRIQTAVQETGTEIKAAKDEAGGNREVAAAGPTEQTDREKEEAERKLQEELKALEERNILLAQIDADANAEKIAANQELILQLEAQSQNADLLALKRQAKTVQEQKKLDEERAQSQIATLNFVSSLSSAKSKELAAIGKAAAISTATIDTYKAANNALGSVPFPFGFLAAAAVVTAGLANVANIVGTPLQTGITAVPPGFNNDTFPARLSSGERVISSPQNADLTEFLSGENGVKQSIDKLISITANQSRETVINIGGESIVAAVQSEIDGGRVLSL